MGKSYFLTTKQDAAVFEVQDSFIMVICTFTGENLVSVPDSSMKIKCWSSVCNERKEDLKTEKLISC